MKYLIFLLSIASLLSGCGEGGPFSCERDSAKARAKGQDPRLFGIWYYVNDHEKVIAGKLEGVRLLQYRPGGYYVMAQRKHLDHSGWDVWYTEGDKIYHGYCKTGSFSIGSVSRYRVHGDTLFTYNLDEQIDPNKPEKYFHLRLKE